jgi:hypothetical protein
MAKGKKITQAQIFGRQGVALVEERLLEMGFTWHPTSQDLEAGIDGFTELRDPATGVVSGAFLHIQSRARSTLEKDTADSFEYTCTQDELDYWLGGTAPVLLVISQPREKRAWWVSIKDYFRLPENKKSRKVRFNKRTDVFDATAADRLRALAAAAGSGAYFRPPPKVETLISNLLPVTRPPAKLYSATTTFRDRDDVRKELRKHVDWPENEYVLHGTSIVSVHDLRDEPWPNVCDPSTIVPIETTDWSHSPDLETRRHFAQLLNHCLSQKCSPMGMKFLKDREVLYFKATNPEDGKTVLPTRKKHYKSRKVKTSRDVFKAYPYKSDPTKIAYYRHVGFERRFRFIGDKWYLEITPTYHFTSDGHQVHPFHEEYLSKIKTFEGNNAIAGLVIMFAALLQDEESLFRQRYEHLGFGHLERVEIKAGINDAAWSQRDETQAVRQPSEIQGEEEASGPTLFEDEC